MPSVLELAVFGDGSLQAWFDAEHAEGTNGIDGETNGIADGSPLVEPCTSEGENVQGLPDDNVLHLLRDVAKKSDGHTLYHGATKLMQAIGKEPEDRRETGSELAVALNTLADMVERDYVRRESIEGVMDTDRELVTENIRLTAERDEWKAKAEHYGDHVDRLMDAIRDLAQKQPRTFDPEAPYKNAELVGKYIDELESRSEGSSKVRAGSSSAKRATAVERLRNCFYTSDSDLMRAMLNWGHEPHTGDDSRFALIDLLTDEPMDAQRDSNGTCPDAMGQSSDAPTLGDLFGVLGDEEPHEEPDSREKLEADIEKRAVHAETILGPLRIGIVKVGTNVIHGWLDRQAEITKREWAHVNDMYIADVRAERDAAESRVDELEAEIAKRDKGIARLKRQRDEARAQLENLARDLAECEREREVYRDACGQLLDLADQMRLVRLDGCAPALVDMDGEVIS